MLIEKKLTYIMPVRAVTVTLYCVVLFDDPVEVYIDGVFGETQEDADLIPDDVLENERKNILAAATTFAKSVLTETTYQL